MLVVLGQLVASRVVVGVRVCEPQPIAGLALSVIGMRVAQRSKQRGQFLILKKSPWTSI